MDFDNVENMKDYSDSDNPEKMTKKELLMGKRKDKKDKKDKERGYAALEGESSADESSSRRSPTKSKKTKSFKFSTKSKEKREKSSDKEAIEKKKEKEKKSEKKIDKEKKSDKKERKFKHLDDHDLTDKLSVFGVKLELAIERSKSHDGIDLPLPVRVCIDHLQANGLYFEGIYKVTGTKSKVLHLKKMYNCREEVNITDYDIPTVTSLLKLYLRDLPDPILTSELLVRFEEAGAILNTATREKHLKILVENLPAHNKLILSYLLLHFDNVILNEKNNKVSVQTLVSSMAPILHISNRLLTALLYHCHSLFSNVLIKKYVPPLKPSESLPTDPELIEDELKKQESLLAEIHSEIQAGFIAPHREELMWEVQRIITQLKRTYKNFLQKDKDVEKPPLEEPPAPTVDIVDSATEKLKQPGTLDYEIELIKSKNRFLNELKQKLERAIEEERIEIGLLRQRIRERPETGTVAYNGSGNLGELMDLLNKENQILQIKKINLVRRIMEQHEMCIDLKAKLCILNV